MSTIEEFETLLKDVVQAKRLSASKMQKLTETALKIMDKDTQMVSILYRTHKATSGSAKLHSLYVFDALARAAKHQANKHGVTSRSQTGNCASFLVKAEGVVEGVFRDMVLSRSSEYKEKAKKILDIWAKGNTFTSTVLSRLASVLKETEKVSEVEVNSAVTPSDPRVPAVISTSGTSALQIPDAQATLLALLTQAASNGINTPVTLQTGVNTAATPIPQLDPTQLAVLQQLAQTVKGNTDIPPTSQVAPSIRLDHLPAAPSTSQLPAPHRDESHVLITKDPRSDRYRSPEQVYGIDSHPDVRTYSRGGMRGGPRGRGRGDRRRWDSGDRDHHYRERERSPSYRDRRSRSRSPANRHSGSRRDANGFSPRLPSGVSFSRQPRDDISAPEPGKDEFGRDLRPQSPDDLPPPTTPTTGSGSVEPAAVVDKPTLDPSPALASSHKQRSMSPSVAANISTSPSEPIITSTESLQPGLEQFDLATFDFTAPTSWEALGKMWRVTNGFLPSTEQLMEFVISCQATSAPQANWNTWGAAPSTKQAWGSGGGIARGGGFVHGKGRNGTEGSWNDDNQYITDAVVLGEPETSTTPTPVENRQGDNQDPGAGGGGRMQRIEDKWVFVKDP